MTNRFLHDLGDTHISQIVLSEELIKQLKEYGIKYYPKESCGILTGSIEENNNLVCSYPKVFNPIKNISKEVNQWDYLMEPQEMFNILKDTHSFDSNSQQEISALFHTHPSSHPTPSIFDTIGASWKTVYLIYGVNVDILKAWFWNGDYFTSVSINNGHPEFKIIDYPKHIKAEWNTWEQAK